MILILCHPGDASAVWVANSLAARAPGPVELVTIDAVLAGTQTLTMTTIEADGSIMLPDGRAIETADVTGLINRLWGLPDGFGAAFKAEDRNYAREEMHAFLLAWLSAFECPIINPPHPRSLSGFWPDPMALHHLAASGGLEVPKDIPFDGPQSADSACLVFRERVYGPIVPQSLASAAIRLSVMIGTDCLEVSFSHDAASVPVFAGANPIGELEIGGRPLMDTIATAFHREKTLA